MNELTKKYVYRFTLGLFAFLAGILWIDRALPKECKCGVYCSCGSDCEKACEKAK